MYQISRAIYRELAPYVEPPRSTEPGALAARQTELLRACEAVVERLGKEPYSFADPARTLFCDIRAYFPIAAQSRVLRVIERYLGFADEFLQNLPQNGFDAYGNPLQCRASTRKGTPCQRMPLPHNGYCPSHQHLAETEAVEHALAA